MNINKKRVQMLISVMVVAILLVTNILSFSAYLKTRDNYIAEMEINKNNNEIISQMQIEIESHRQELELMREAFTKLKEMYLEEIEPVSFNANDLTHSSNATENDLRLALTGTGLEGLEAYYIEAENMYGVNSLFLVGLTAQESGWGLSTRAQEQNNLSGYAVFSRGAEGKTFNSKGESILETARLIALEYLDSNGRYHSGKSIYSVNKLYCPNDDYFWSSNISKITHSLIKKINGI